MLHQAEIESRLVALGEHRHDGSASSAFLARLDTALPINSISTKQFAATERMLVNQGGEPFAYDRTKTPYSDAMMDALDHPLVRLVAVKGNTRSGKTVAAENFALKRWKYGPATNVIWFAQDEDSINDYIDERGEEMLHVHKEIAEKIDWSDRKNGRKRKMIGKSLLLYRPATMRALRMKAAPLIVGDEIDAWIPKTRDAAPTLITSRQEEFGSAAKAFVASHPDAGPDGGIDKILKDCLEHLWWVQCPHCHNAMSPAAEAEDTDARINWNVPEMMPMAENMERHDFLDYVMENVVLVCPHEGCHATFDKDERIGLMGTGQWLQSHQRLLPDGTVEGEARVSGWMGFVIHAFMAPFVRLAETAKDWASAKLSFDQTGNDVQLREVIVKKLGETYFGAKDDEIIETAKVVHGRLGARYELKTVPAGVKFITAFVDVQGDRFEVRVIGWDLGKQSWLIDAYAIKQWPRSGEHGAFDNIDPGNKLSDWDILEESVLTAEYPLADNPTRIALGKQPLFMPIARTMIDAVGNPGVTANARSWLANLLKRQPGGGKRIIDSYRIQLVHGASKRDGPDLYGKPKQIEFDDAGKPFAVPVYERYPIVHQIKRIIARRMKIAEPGPGKMNMPSNVTMRYARELTAERLINGKWVRSRDNETWDGWVMCEVARESMKPDRPGLFDPDNLPEWAEPRPKGQGIDSAPVEAVNPFDRLAQINQGIPGEQTR